MKLTSWGIITGIAVGGLIASSSCDRVSATTTVLYDGASGVLPDAGANPFLSFGTTGGAVTTANNGVTTLDTTSTLLTYAGYSNYKNTTLLTPTLDSNAGYTLSFTVKLNSQTNNSPFRSGFSAIVLGNDNKGIEIGFRGTDIFAQPGKDFNSIVTSEQKIYPSSILGTQTTYDLAVKNNTYTLSGDGNELFGGLLRDYNGAILPPSLPNVYAIPNFIFLGDDSGSASASVDFKTIMLVTNNTAVPEPSNLLGIGLAIWLGAKLKQKLGKISHKIRTFE
jgi:hypothetical protein